MKTLKNTFLSLLAVTAMGGMAFAQEMKKEVGCRRRPGQYRGMGGLY